MDGVSWGKRRASINLIRNTFSKYHGILKKKRSWPNRWSVPRKDESNVTSQYKPAFSFPPIGVKLTCPKKQAFWATQVRLHWLHFHLVSNANVSSCLWFVILGFVSDPLFFQIWFVGVKQRTSWETVTGSGYRGFSHVHCTSRKCCLESN